ncbi:tetratricopeptide repeat protein [Thermovibrio sp.]
MRALLTILLLLFLTLPSFGEVNGDEVLYKRGLYQYKVGSYSTALDYFLRLLKPNSKYYDKALLMLSKTYYAIGKKTGLKRYLWQALNYLQLYFIEVSSRELPWEYYYTKAQIYESLSFYEQAFALYRVAFLKAKTQRQKVDTTIGIIRTAVWIRRPEVVEEYFILVSTQKNLTEYEKRELAFVRGLYLFTKGKYKEALPYFYKLYKEYEGYLIDNPTYYYLIAEDIYRLGKLNLAEHLFRRIASLTGDREVVRRATLRLGDIELRRKNYKLAFVYYYSVIRDYPDSLEAKVARLKVIPMMDNPEVRYRALLTKDGAFREPIRYISRLLVNYRTTYVGIYALADLGYLVFKLGSPEKVFKRLTWEVSLVFPEEIKYEQREFIRYLWKPYLFKLPPKKACFLYRSNPRFFEELFGRGLLLKFAKDLKLCNMRILRYRLLSFMLKRWRDDETKLLMAQALFESRDFKEAFKVLSKVKNKNCRYWVVLGKLSLFLPEVNFTLSDLNSSCKKPSVDTVSLSIYYLAKSGMIESAFNLFLKFEEDLTKDYRKELVVKAALNQLLERATLEGNYQISYGVSKALFNGWSRDCLVGSYLLISSSRLKRLKEAKEAYEAVRGCIDSFSFIAKTVYEGLRLEEEVDSGSLSTVDSH